MQSEPCTAVSDSQAAELPRMIEGYRDRHAGETIIVCGCGRSLRDLPVSTSTVTIGVNDVGRHFDPTYLVVLNSRSQFHGERFKYVESSRAQALFSQLPIDVTQTQLIRFALGKRGGTDPFDPHQMPYTKNSPYVAVCLAAFMGAKRIGLIGVDFTDGHFFGQTGRHSLSRDLASIDKEYAHLESELGRQGIELVNLSEESRLTSLRKVPMQDYLEFSADEDTLATEGLSVVSYSVTPVAGVPVVLSRCIEAATSHQSACVWASNSYGNGVRFEGGVQWRHDAAGALELIDRADLVIVHNGKVDQRHRRLIESKPAIVMAHNYGWNVDFGLVRKGSPGVVIGQYQATLDEFRDWRIAPNPVPIWEPEYSPGEKNRELTICYTPSGKHERYPENHRLYWHSKGYDTTMRVLEALEKRYGLRLEVIRDRQISHEQSLAMKRRAHIVIDECVTGSYHRNSLEGLSTGCVVVNGVGDLAGVEDVFLRCAGAGSNSPFVHADLESLETVLTGLIETGEEGLLRAGASSRQWMEKHWAFDSQWANFWEAPVAEAVDRATGRTARRVTPKMNNAAPPNVVQRQPKLRRGVTVVIPHGGEERLRHLAASLINLRQQPGEIDVVVAEMGATPFAKSLAHRWKAKYVFIENENEFERARTLNVGSTLAETDLILWKDGDLLLPAPFLEVAEAEFRKRRLDNLVPYRFIDYLGPESSEQVFAGTIGPASCRPDKRLFSGRHVAGGAALVRVEFLQQYGGIPDSFRGWGGEDNAWMHKARLLGKSAITGNANQCLYHLYHPDSGAYHGGPRTANPHYADNVAQLQQVHKVRSASEFLRRFPADRQQACPWSPDAKIRILHSERTTAESDTIAAGLESLYGVVPDRHLVKKGESLKCVDGDAGGYVITDPAILPALIDGAETVLPRAVSLITAATRDAQDDAAVLGRPGALAGAPPPGVSRTFWPIGNDRHFDKYAVTLAQPLSLLIAGHDGDPSDADGPTDAPDRQYSEPGDNNTTLPVWTYWEGECPQWIERCLATIRRHGGNARVLDRSSFDALWDRDRDIDIDALHVAHRADFIRAFLLAHHGGLWLDADCIVMRSLEPLLAELDCREFVAHKDRQGFYPNGFIGACRGSEIAAEFYRLVCDRLRSGTPLGWISLGGEPLTQLLKKRQSGLHELPCEVIQPVCWSEPEAFFERASNTVHANRVHESAICYMMSNTEVNKLTERTPSASLLHDDTFFQFLLKRSLGNRSSEYYLMSEPVVEALVQETDIFLRTLAHTRPRRVLDLAPGRGRRGILAREFFDNAPLCVDDQAETEVRAVVTRNGKEINQAYDVVDDVAPESALKVIEKGWDLVVFGGDWIGWSQDEARQALEAAIQRCGYSLVFYPRDEDKAVGFGNKLIDGLASYSIWSSRSTQEKDDNLAAYLFSARDPEDMASHAEFATIFGDIYRSNLRTGSESASGPGSSLGQTVEIRERLPFLLQDLGVRSMLDAPCGDFNWMRHVALDVDRYVGVDVVDEIVSRNRAQFGSSTRQFEQADIARDDLPKVDLILCRDCLVHFSFADAHRALRNLKRSGAKYLLTTTFPDRENTDIATGDWRPLNFEQPPFNFPEPLRLINEKCTEARGQFRDKSLGLWRFADLPVRAVDATT